MVKDVPDFSFSQRRLPLKLRITAPPSTTATRKTNLGCIILASSHSQHVKFSELSLDCFRMILSLESEIVARDNSQQQQKQEKPAPNPSKYILYRPTVSSLLQYVASAQKEARDNSALLLYISADGEKGFSIRSGSDPNVKPYSRGGIMLRPEGKQEPASSGLYVSRDCLYSDDMLPFLRRPTFLIIDSDNASSFSSLSSTIFGAPVLVLCSPNKQLPGLLDPEQAGSMFTFFLTDPIAAFCSLVSRSVLTAQAYQELQTISSTMFQKLTTAISTTSDLRTSCC